MTLNTWVKSRYKIVKDLNHKQMHRKQRVIHTKTKLNSKVEKSNLLVEDRLGLTTISRLFAVITALALR
jgi:hypothetical protein